MSFGGLTGDSGAAAPAAAASTTETAGTSPAIEAIADAGGNWAADLANRRGGAEGTTAPPVVKTAQPRGLGLLDVEPATEATATTETTTAETDAAKAAAAAGTEQTQPPVDGWAALAEKLKTEAAAAGYDTPEKYLAARQAAAAATTEQDSARNTHLRSEHDRISTDLKVQMDAGQISLQVAQRIYEAEMQLAGSKYDAEQQQAVHEKSQADNQLTALQRTINTDWETAVKANPALGAGDGAGKTFVELLGVSGIVPHAAAIELLKRYTDAAVQQGVAQFQASLAKGEAAPPYIAPGGGTTNAVQQGGGINPVGDWTKDLFRRAGF